jgi:carbon monoxide dehydrogenase subunit G
MPTTRRSRALAASPERVWAVAADPHHMSRWWPGVSRMEGVEEDRFTEVHMTRKGRGIRIDYRVLESEPPGDGSAGLRRWEQDVIGTPFERVLNEAVTEMSVVGDGEGARVEIVLRQKLRGSSKFGGVMLRRATARRLEEALENLARIC